MGKKIRVMLLILGILSASYGVLGFVETNYRTDAFVHGQNFPITLMCNYGELANKQITVGETEWNFRFIENQWLQTAITQISGGNSSIWLIHAGASEPIYEVYGLSINQTFQYSGYTKAGAYLWEFKGNSSTIIVRATASYNIQSLWIGNCFGGPVSNRFDD